MRGANICQINRGNAFFVSATSGLISGVRKESEFLCHPAFDESEYDSLAVSQNKCVMANAPMDIKDEELETKGDNKVIIISKHY